MKALSIKLKEFRPILISSEQTAYFKNRFIAERGRLISDITDICGSKYLSGFIVAMDIEKTFDTLSQSFLILVLKKFVFGQNYINLIETLSKDQNLCNINGGKTTPYFTLGRGICQGNQSQPFYLSFILKICSRQLNIFRDSSN